MRVEGNQFAGRQGVALVHSVAVTDLRWLFREQAVSDVGIDAHLEIVSDGHATGRLLALQIKSGDSYFQEAVADGFVFRGDHRHLNYWLQHTLPVIVVICRPGTREAYWQLVSDHNVVRTDRGWKMTIPLTNRFQAEAMNQLQAIALDRVVEPEGEDLVRRSESLTHPDVILGALLADASRLDNDRHVIETRSVAYTCRSIASMDDLLAILISTNSPDGTVFVLRRREDRWIVAAHIPVRTKYSDSLPARFVRSESGYCLVVEHPTMWGSGTLLQEQRWYLLARKPRLVLSFPVLGYVVGWGLLFDREIRGASTMALAEIRGGVSLELQFTVRYSPSSDSPKYRGASGFESANTIRLEWQQGREAFSVLPGSDISLDGAFGLYGDNDAGFVRRYRHVLAGLASRPSEGLRSWLLDLSERADADEREVLQRAMARERA